MTSSGNVSTVSPVPMKSLAQARQAINMDDLRGWDTSMDSQS
jgi:hypothetical protein